LGDEILEIQKSRAFTVIEKNDGSPVTSADYLAHERILNWLKAQFPDDEIISEEDEFHEPPPKKRVWFIDPIDGTKNFISGKNPFFFLMGLAIDGRATFGLEYLPDLNSMIYTLNNRDYLTTGDDGRSTETVGFRQLLTALAGPRSVLSL
jgi:3'-phosphoadenosine 5'-phosphosulfate (PAPS) 3'-phosphatase